MNTTVATTAVEQPTTEEKCALELYDSSILLKHVSWWWTFLHDGIATPQDIRKYLHGAMIAIPCAEAATFYELNFLAQLIDSYPEDKNVP